MRSRKISDKDKAAVKTSKYQMYDYLKDSSLNFSFDGKNSGSTNKC